MAVEIPVYVDIDGAFKQAADRVPQAIAPLQRQISKKQLNVKVDVGTPKHPKLRAFKDLLNESQSSATQLERAIKSVNSQINALSKAGGFNPTKGLKASERDLLALRAALETKLEAGNFIDNATEKIKRLSAESRVAGREASNSIVRVNSGLRTQGGLLSMLTRYLTAYTAVFAGIRLIKNVREVTAEFEMQRVALAGIIQDSTRASQLFAQIKAAAVQSPFEIKDLVSFTKQLSAYRIETDKLFDVTMRLADVSAGLGVDMSRLVLAYGQVRAASVLRGQELRQFTEAGIPLVDLLAKKFSQLRNEVVSTGEVFELISNRAVPFAMIEEIFNDMTSAGGIFYEMQLKQSETLKGQWMKLKDVISIAYDEMGRSSLVNSAMRGWIQTISRVVKEWERLASILNVAVYSFLSYRAAVTGLIPLYNIQQRAIARQIKLEKQQQIEQIRLASRTNQLSKADQKRIANIKKMNVEDIKRIYSMNQMTQAQASMFFWRNRDNKEIVKAITQTGVLTKTQMAAIKQMSWLQIRIKTWGSSIRTFFTKIGSAVASFWPIAAMSAVITTIMGLVQAHSSQVDAISKVDKAYDEQAQSLLVIENGYRKIQQAIEDVADEQERTVKEAALFGQKLSYAQNIVDTLKKFGLGGDFDLSLLNTDNIDEFVEHWLERLNEANEVTRDWGRSVAQVANAWEASILGIHFAGDNLNTDIKQLTNAYVKMTSDKEFRKNLNEMRNYLESLQINWSGRYGLLSVALGEDAQLAIAQKRRNETEYQYQQRIIKNYEKIRQYAQSDRFMLSGAMKFFKPMTDYLTNFESKLDEVEREFDKTWGSLEGKDEVTIKMAIDKLFAENQWEDWLKEAWIERINGKYHMNIQVVPVVGKVDIPRGMKGILSTEFEGLFTDQELENMNSVSEIGQAIEDKMKKAIEAIEEVDKLANNFANNDAWSEKTKEKIKQAQLVINEELAKSEKDRNREAINQAIEQIDALTKQNGLYDEQILKKKESARAEYELARAAKERLLNEGLSDMGKDIKQTFPGLISPNQIIDKMDLEVIGKKMKEAFPDASADLLARPLVDAAELVRKGWEDAGEGIATVFSSTFEYTDEQGRTRNILVTPILPDGSVLSPEELDEYVGTIIQSSDMRSADTNKLILGFDVPEDAGQRLHEMQEAYYDLADRMKNVSNRFLISEDDLKGIRDASDAYDIWEKNTKAIADEREKMANAGVSEQTVSEEQARLDAERLAIEQRLAELNEQIADSSYEEEKARYDSLRLAVGMATTAEARKVAEDELANFIAETNIEERAILKVEQQRLLTQLGITNSALGAQKAIADYFKVLDEAGNFWEEFGKRYNFTLKDKPKGGGSQQDPWIMLFKNRMKFMQDFQKGVEDLDKYLVHSASLGREQEIMKGRGLSLGIKTEDLLGTPNELREWYDKAIKEVVSKIRSMGGREFAGLGVTEILAKDLTGRKIQKYQELLQELWKDWTDFDTSQLKKNMEDALKKVSDELKRSETARNFFQNILDLTGDEDLAATMSVSIYGGIGDDFKDRMQKQLDGALEALKVDDHFELTKEIEDAFRNMDFEKILSIAELPQNVEKVVREAYENMQKHNADWVTDLMKTYQKSKTYEERITDIQKREAQTRKEIAESTTLSDEQKATYTAASFERENRDVATVQVEALKNTYEWGKAFEDLDRVGNVTLTNLRQKLEDLIEAQKEFLTPEQLKALTEALEKVRNMQANRDPLEAITSGGSRALMIAPAIKSKPESDTYKEAIKKIKEFNENAKETERIDIDHLEDEFRAANKTMEDGINGIVEYVNAWKSVADVISDAFNLDDIPVLGETLQGVSDALSFVAKILPVIITLNGILNATLMANPFIAAAAAIIATIGAIVGLIKGIINAKVEKLNKKIEEQVKLLDELEHQYDRIEDAMEKSFGSDYIYNYNKQLEILLAKQEAYLEQARLEGEKGKKKDEDKIKEYENSARDAADKIAEMQTQLSEFFSGTDLTSAAEDFASAWIDAYKEFGSTADAMSEKFQEMIESMINRSLAARIMQEMLQPIFDQIDTMARDGLLSTEEIASVAALAQERIPMINDAMTNLMTSLASAGLDVRTSTAGLKGISKSIAGTSEESVLGLAAAVNTQNYYMSFMPTINENVAMILSVMTGGTGTTRRNAPSVAGENMEEMPSIQQMVYDHLPMMDQNLSEMLRLFKSVLTTKNSSTNTNYIAVK